MKDIKLDLNRVILSEAQRGAAKVSDNRDMLKAENKALKEELKRHKKLLKRLEKIISGFNTL